MARVFISYSHDSESHGLKVLELSNRLRADGVDARLDRYEQKPREGWPRWMINEVELADFVLVICTLNYRKRFEGTTEDRGVQWEGALINQELYDAVARNQKMIPVVFGDSGEVIPKALRPFTFYKYPEAYDALYRLLTGQPNITPTGLGSVRDLGTSHPNPPKRVQSQGAVEVRLPKQLSAPKTSLGNRANRLHAVSLQRIWRSGRLSIVAGAGLGVESGMPNWNDLLGTMLTEYVHRHYAFPDAGSTDRLISDLADHLERQSPLVYAQFLRSRLSEDEFTSLVHRALYGDRIEPRPGELCRAIARLGHHLNSVLTFNYDDLLEQALVSEGYECTPIYKADSWASASGIPVYHPHGYLPGRMEPDQFYPLVLAESDYHSQYYAPHGWRNVAISRVLLENVCLFVGTSLTDPNMRRLLDASHREQPDKKHYIIAPSPVAKNTPVDSGVGQAVLEVFAASYQELGVDPLWFDEHAQIPEIVNSIRDLRLESS